MLFLCLICFGILCLRHLVFLIGWLPPNSTLTDTLVPITTLFPSQREGRLFTVSQRARRLLFLRRRTRLVLARHRGDTLDQRFLLTDHLGDFVRFGLELVGAIIVGRSGNLARKLLFRRVKRAVVDRMLDRKSTRLNSSH